MRVVQREGGVREAKRRRARVATRAAPTTTRVQRRRGTTGVRPRRRRVVGETVESSRVVQQRVRAVHHDTKRASVAASHASSDARRTSDPSSDVSDFARLEPGEVVAPSRTRARARGAPPPNVHRSVGGSRLMRDQRVEPWRSRVVGEVVEVIGVVGGVVGGVGRRGSVARLRRSPRFGRVSRSPRSVRVSAAVFASVFAGLRGGLLGGSDGAREVRRRGGSAVARDAASRADANSPEARPASRSSAPPKMAPPTNTWGTVRMPDAAREASRIAPSGADASISTNATFAASSAVFARRQCGHPLVVTNATTGAEGADDDASSERSRRTKRRLGPREPREGRRTPSAATRDEATRPRAPRRRRREGSRGVHRARCAVSGRRDRDEE